MNTIGSDKRHLIVAVVLTAVVSLVVLSGCVTKRDIEEINIRLDRIEQKAVQTQRLVAQMDSTNTASAEADKKLRNDMQQTVLDLQGQIAKLLENYNDLLTKVDALSRSKSRIQSSPGAQDGGEGTTATPQSSDCDNAYDEAFLLVRKGDYDKAITGFRGFLTTCPKHASTENAYYWIGECYYSLEKYSDAITEFEYLLKTYKATANASRALYKLGRSKQELGQKADAKKIFQRLIDEHGGTLEAEQAKERLKELK
ncbi:MAG: tol-pal system protein YbgF [Candidatus Zixiibacteriota bacterium]